MIYRGCGPRRGTAYAALLANVTDVAFRRTVVYVAGFDVIGPRFYRLLFKRGLAQDSARSQRNLRLVEAPPQWPAAWSCSFTASDGPRPVEIEYHVLTPHELVAPFHGRNAVVVAWNWLRVLFAYLRYGVGWRICATSAKTGVVLTCAMALPLAIFSAGATAAHFVPSLVISGPPTAIEALCGFAGGLAALQAYAVRDHGASLNLLLSSMAVGTAGASGKLPTFEAIVEAFARFTVERAEAARPNEILVIGHSSGTIMAVDMMARVLDHIGEAGPRLSLITLGSTHGIVTFFPHAERQRAAFARVATSPNVRWMEYFSARDFICMGRRDPIAAARIDLRGKRQFGPIIRRLSVSKFYSHERVRRMRFSFFDRHFDYLKAGDRDSEYNLFRKICAAKPLENDG